MSVAVVLSFTTSISAQSSNIQTSFFTKDLVNTILAQPGCAGLRMYPAVNNNSNVVLIIGIDGGGNEISSNYQMFTGLRDNNATYSSVGKSQAKTYCDTYFSNNESFSSDISKSTISALLSGSSLGISIQASGGNNFMVSSYIRGSEGLTPSGGAKPGDPCPNACGSASQYLVFPNSGE